MNAKILYAATVALALASSLAVAQESRPLTRAEVNKAWAEAAADGTLRKNDYDYDANDFKARSTRTRAEVIAELRVPRDPALIGPLANRTYNPAGMETLRVSTLAPGAGQGRGRRRGPRRDAAPHRLRRRSPVRRPPQPGPHAGSGPGRCHRCRLGQLSSSPRVKAAFGRLFSWPARDARNRSPG